MTAEAREEAVSDASLAEALAAATAGLLGELRPSGHWTGALSSSALSTATAVIALSEMDRARNVAENRNLIVGGLHWLAANVNADGGWGDTIRSRSNISTTALCWAAIGAAGADAEYPALVTGAKTWLAAAAGSLEGLPAAIEARYGKDKTFSVPILMTLALSGRLGPNGWRKVQALPFELAALPHQFFAAVRLPVVSYALPALIAIGQTIHHHQRSAWRVIAWLRDRCRSVTLRVLTSLQPENGGFLEATPLTSFVTMSLASMGLQEHVVARKGRGFLRASVLADGSWAIDTDLATWVTTLAIKALAYQPLLLSPEQKFTLREWLLGQQYRCEHPYTHAAPGGWAWTNLPGGVPDADDTPGALLALLELGAVTTESRHAGLAALLWLLDLQNRDGGMPTFCRGWGALPFDRSSADLTAHSLRAWSAWLPQTDAALTAGLQRGIARGLEFLRARQEADGSWAPLWFGNEATADETNPLYGTTHVVLALLELRNRSIAIPDRSLAAGLDWLDEAQNADGGWGGQRGVSSSVEETALAIEALAGTSKVRAVERGTRWLVDQIEAGTWRKASPIGYYFAKLWYFEELYPVVFTVAALGKVAALRKLTARGEGPE